MTTPLRSLLLTLFLLASPASLLAQGFSLDFIQIAGPLRLLSERDSVAVEQTIALIRDGEHAAALIRLTPLVDTHPDNSSIRILSAYVKLQVGNLLGAFEDGKLAHKAPNGTHYKCDFLARVALAAGDLKACRREIGHLKGDPNFKEEVAELGQALKEKESAARGGR